MTRPLRENEKLTGTSASGHVLTVHTQDKHVVEQYVYIIILYQLTWQTQLILGGRLHISVRSKRTESDSRSVSCVQIKTDQDSGIQCTLGRCLLLTPTVHAHTFMFCHINHKLLWTERRIRFYSFLTAFLLKAGNSEPKPNFKIFV